MSRRSLSEQQREAADQARRETVEQLHRQLAEHVGSLDNRAEWQRYLAFARSFHQYSFGNRLLIMLQAPDATVVAGYRAWQAKGYQVRRGERAIRVLGPVTRREPVLDAAGNAVFDADGKRREVRRLVGVRPVSVFDIAQTDGPAPPEHPVPVLLSGQAPSGLWDSLATPLPSVGSGWNVATARGRTASPSTASVSSGSGMMWTTRRRSSRWPTSWATS